MKEYINLIHNILKENIETCKSNTLALSGGLDSTILAYYLRNRKPNAITITSKNFRSTDLMYCQQVAHVFNIKLELYKIKTTEIITSINNTIKILKNFNDIEIRNSVTMYIVLKLLKKKGYKKIITGDGADELFCGYNFLLNKNQSELKNEYKRILDIMHFPILKLAEALDMKVELPFLGTNMIKLAKKIPLNLKINLKNNKKYGKFILRKLIENKISHDIVWRHKSPIQDGSGTVGLTDFFNKLIDDGIFIKKIHDIYSNDKVIIRSKESLYYYNIFRTMYKPPFKTSQKYELKCPNCQYHIKFNTKFCLMCGSFPI